MHYFFLLSKTERTQPDDLCLLAFLWQEAYIVFHHKLWYILQRIHYFFADFDIWIQSLLTLMRQFIEIYLLDHFKLKFLRVFIETAVEIFYFTSNWIKLLLFCLFLEDIFSSITYDTTILLNVTHLLHLKFILSPFLSLNELVPCYFKGKLLGSWATATLNKTFSEMGSEAKSWFLLALFNSNFRKALYIVVLTLDWNGYLLFWFSRLEG